MTPQEILDTVAQHLIRQGVRAFDESTNTCRYLTADGLRCAVGALIPDEFLTFELASSKVDARHLARDFLLPEWYAPNVELLQDLQAVHDYGCNWSDEGVSTSMTEDLRQVATDHGLDAAILTKLGYPEECQ